MLCSYVISEVLCAHFVDHAKRGELSLVRKIRCYKTGGCYYRRLLLLLLLLYLHSCVFLRKG